MSSPGFASLRFFVRGIFFPLMLWSIGCAAQPPYKCSEGGKIVYQSMACTGNAVRVLTEREIYEAEKEEAKDKQNKAAARAAEQSQESYQRGREREQEAENKEGIARCGKYWRMEPQLGMKSDVVENCSTWGAPNKKNDTITIRGTRSQWVYDPRRSPAHGYLYINEYGLVETVQKIDSR